MFRFMPEKVSSPLTRLIKRVKYNRFSKEWHATRDGPRAEHPNSLKLELTNKYHYYTIGLLGLTGLYAFAV